MGALCSVSPARELVCRRLYTAEFVRPLSMQITVSMRCPSHSTEECVWCTSSSVNSQKFTLNLFQKGPGPTIG